MRLVVAIDGPPRGEVVETTVPPEAIAGVRQVIGGDLLVLFRTGDPEIHVARVIEINVTRNAPTTRLEIGRLLGQASYFSGHLDTTLTFQQISDASYDAILRGADAALFPQPPTTPMAGFEEEFAVRSPDVPTAAAAIATLRRETGNRCALTNVLLAADAIPSAIRSDGQAPFHVNNLLLLSPDAEAAFRDGHFSARDDFSILVDLALIDPELLDRINISGRLNLPENPALQPSPENLAWHRRHIFRLG